MKKVYKISALRQFIILGSLLGSVQGVFAQSFKGSFSASESEVKWHEKETKRFTNIAQDCLETSYAHHVDFFKRYGISPYYGSNTWFRRASTADKRAFLKKIGKNPDLVSQMEITSCVGFAMKCYQKAFEATGQGAVWLRLNSYMGKNDYDGSAMIEALRSLGWYVMFWNPDPSKNEAWDRDERARTSSNNGSWGYHAYRYATVTKQKKYYKNNIDDAHTMVGFDDRPPASFRRARLFLGVAHTGYHVFAGFKGYVIEGHSTRDIRDFSTLEVGDFNPLANGGAPHGLYRSGLVAVPPGEEP